MNKTIKIFGRIGCYKCEIVKNKLKLDCYPSDIKFTYYDMDTIDGIAEGAYYDVMSLPTTIIEFDKEIVGRFDGEIWEIDEIKAILDK